MDFERFFCVVHACDDGGGRLACSNGEVWGHTCLEMFVHVQTLHCCKAPGNPTQQVFCPGFDPQQLFLIFLFFFPLVPLNTFILCGLYSTCTVHVETLAS